MYFDEFETPLGKMIVAGDEAGLRYATWSRDTSQWTRDRDKARPVRNQLAAYFAGELTRFELTLAPQGTPFQQQVWQALQTIEYGETTSYGQLAQQLGRPTGARAVGHANGKNPIAIVIPCHRVIGKSGKLTGYAGGLDRKRALLTLEGQVQGH